MTHFKKSMMTVAVGLLATFATLAQPGLGGINWTHDLSVDPVNLVYPGSNNSATASSYTVEANTPIDVQVLVKNLSSNRSSAYSIKLAWSSGEGGLTDIATVNGSPLPYNGQMMHSLKWTAAQSGKLTLWAHLTPTGALPGAGKQPCVECKRARSNRTSSSSRLPGEAAPGQCYFPSGSCTLGDMGGLCSCHPTADNPQNNSRNVSVLVNGGKGTTPASVPSADGVDLVVEGAYVTPSIAKLGSYDAAVTIANRGNRAHSGMIQVEVTVGRNKRMVTLTGGLRPGEVKTELVEFTKDGACKVVVDPGNSIRESNETNNSH